jgi:hypothetical protein
MRQLAKPWLWRARQINVSEGLTLQGLRQPWRRSGFNDRLYQKKPVGL